MHTKLFSSQIVQNHQFSSHYYSFIQLCRGCAEVSESQSIFNKSKVVDDVPQLMKITWKYVFLFLSQKVSNATILTSVLLPGAILTILISEKVYSWSPKISYIRNLKKFPQESMCFCYWYRKWWNVQKNVPFPKRVHFQVLFQFFVWFVHIPKDGGSAALFPESKWCRRRLRGLRRRTRGDFLHWHDSTSRWTKLNYR